MAIIQYLHPTDALIHNDYPSWVTNLIVGVALLALGFSGAYFFATEAFNQILKGTI